MKILLFSILQSSTETGESLNTVYYILLVFLSINECMNLHRFYFDSEHVGLGDVIMAGSGMQSRFRTGAQVYLMYTFGGNADSISIGGDPNKKLVGSKMEIGVAVSQDGAHWSRFKVLR